MFDSPSKKTHNIFLAKEKTINWIWKILKTFQSTKNALYTQNNCLKVRLLLIMHCAIDVISFLQVWSICFWASKFSLTLKKVSTDDASIINLSFPSNYLSFPSKTSAIFTLHTPHTKNWKIIYLFLQKSLPCSLYTQNTHTKTLEIIQMSNNRCISYIIQF